MNLIKKIIKRLVYDGLILHLSSTKQKIVNFRVKSKHQAALVRTKKKDRIRVVFMCLFEEVWKVDKVYKEMEQSPRFDPVILICPIVNYGHENMVTRMNNCYSYFVKKGYTVIKSYNEESGCYLDLRTELLPDILFYTNPYKGLIDDRYYISHYPDILTAYVPYYFHEGVAYDIAYNSYFQNVLWRRYAETAFHYSLSLQYATNKGRNTVVTGYPGIESLIDHHMPSDKMWPKKGLKRIIWAPHHTLEAVHTCNYSCFLIYCDFMLEMVEKYSNSIQIVFKPHPLLRNRLNLLWGEETTNNYYGRWESLPNTALLEGEYNDLFLSSDAMIHDSGSFLIEYLYVNKPVLRTLNDIPLDKLYNQFALECLEQYYLASTKEDIEKFIVNVINDVDPLKEPRTKFINDILMPKGSPSQNIVDDILDSIDNQILYRN